APYLFDGSEADRIVDALVVGLNAAGSEFHQHHVVTEGSEAAAARLAPRGRASRSRAERPRECWQMKKFRAVRAKGVPSSFFRQRSRKRPNIETLKHGEVPMSNELTEYKMPTAIRFEDF